MNDLFHFTTNRALLLSLAIYSAVFGFLLGDIKSGFFGVILGILMAFWPFALLCLLAGCITLGGWVLGKVEAHLWQFFFSILAVWTLLYLITTWALS